MAPAGPVEMAAAVAVPGEGAVQVGLVADLERLDVAAADAATAARGLGGRDRRPAGGEVDAEDQLCVEGGRERPGGCAASRA